MTNNERKRDSSVMMSSTMPSAKYSCAGSSLRLVKGRTAIDGLSGRGGRVSTGAAERGVSADRCSSCTAPTKRNPLPRSVLIKR